VKSTEYKTKNIDEEGFFVGQRINTVSSPEPLL